MKQQNLCLKSRQAAIHSAIAKIPVLLFIPNFFAMRTDKQCCRLTGSSFSLHLRRCSTSSWAKPWEALSDLRASPALSQRPEHTPSWGCSQTELSYYPIQFMLVSEASGFCFSVANSLDAFLLLASFLPSVQHFTWNYDNWLPIHPVYHLLLVPSLVTAIHTTFACNTDLNRIKWKRLTATAED